MPTVKVNTSDTAWLGRHALEEPVAYGTDIRGVMYFTAPVTAWRVEYVAFAGVTMIRFEFAADKPADHPKAAMYPETYLVEK